MAARDHRNPHVLLADCDRALDFPRLRTDEADAPIQLYFARSMRPRHEKAKQHRAWMRLEVVEETFGAIVERWLNEYEKYGPGFHLYLGNRRGHSMYQEHRFASLMWGLESLHRSLVPVQENAKQAEKVARIISQIETAGDRRWAARHLPKTSEPSLGDRIRQLVCMLPIQFDDTQLRAFAQLCAKRRNDVSHFGGARRAGEYDAFIADITRLSPAIELFYHASLLQIAGVPQRLITWYFLRGLNITTVQKKLAEANLSLRDEAV